MLKNCLKNYLGYNLTPFGYNLQKVKQFINFLLYINYSYFFYTMFYCTRRFVSEET